MRTFEHRETKNPDIERVVDRDGNWEHYFHIPSKTYLRGVTSILKKGYAKGQGFYQFLSRHTEAERDEILAKAGEKGDKVHRTIDLMLSADGRTVIDRDTLVMNRETQMEERLSNGEWDALLSFARFWNAHDPEIFFSEATLYSLEGRYAGTSDACLRLRKSCGVKTCKCEALVGKIGIFDWKTGSGIWPEYTAQCAAYAMADNIKEYLPKKAAIDYTAIVRLGTAHKTTGGYELKPTFDIGIDYLRFIAASEIANYEWPDFDPGKIEEIPDEIAITAQRAVIAAPEKPKAKKKGVKNTKK
jgi:hypothetical protein